MVPCSGRPSGPFQTDLGTFAAELGGTKPPGADFRSVALPNPPHLPDLPHARTGSARPATHEPELSVNVDRVGVPSRPASG